MAFNGTVEMEGEGLGRLEDGRLVRDVVGALPVLVKLLDSDERLVIQAHPTVSFAHEFMNSSVGKTECWYFLSGIDPTACVYLGFKPGITREKWKSAVTAAIAKPGADPEWVAQRGRDLLSLMHKVPVKAGDFVFVDGGVPHAIGGGCFMIELQEPSDLMVVAERFTPSGRELPEKKLHGGLGFEKMFDVYDYAGLTFDELCSKYVKFQSVNAVGTRAAPNVRCVVGPELTDKFEMWEMTSTGRLPLTGAGAVVVVTEGEGALNGLEVRKGDRLVVTGERELFLSGMARVSACFSRKEK